MPACFFPLWKHAIYEQAGGPTGTSATGTTNVLSLLLIISIFQNSVVKLLLLMAVS